VALLAPDPQRIARGSREPAADRVPDELAGGTPPSLRAELEALLGTDRVLGRVIDLVRYASDASPYRLMPLAVVVPRGAEEVAALMAWSRQGGVPLTFRAAGTSLNGQSQGDGVLVDVRRHFAGVAVEDDGRAARVKPGTILGHANRVLLPHGRKLGPDPASTDFATVGGVLANNSGGMRCGVVADSYSTVRSLTFVLPSGTTIDTAAPGAEERFAEAEPELATGLAAIREEILADDALSERIRRKFEIKNTTGYRICAFLDGDTPLEVFRRLLIGSEGTLGFVSEAVFETVELPKLTTLSWIHFPSIAAATGPVPELVASGASAVEMMVAPALIVASHNIPGAPESWRELPPESAALLVEYPGDDERELAAHEAACVEALAGREVTSGPDFTHDPETIEVYWRVREGLHGLVGKLRLPGTALIVEDVCVPPARIAECATDLQALLGEHGFLTGVAGHTSAGNLHFMLTPDFSKPEDLERYESFMSKLVELVLDKYDGSLKAEHGTGVNMAPYVEREWGAKATELMWRVKELADPDGVLAPGVVLNRDPGVHLRNLKTTPPIEEVATTCVECGFCEPVCPSRNLTTTPRQRIVIRREIARQTDASPVARALLEQYEYDGVETCAADGSCVLACPVGIDTGVLVKQFRGRQRTPAAEGAALALARRWERVERLARRGLRAGQVASRVIGDRGVAALAGAVRGPLAEELIPAWPENMPPPASPALPATRREGAAAVYLPACINRIFGRSRELPDGPSLPEAMVAVSTRADRPVWIPPDAAGHCCATPWISKGFARGAEAMANRTVEALWRWSGEGELPIVCDASSCTLGLAAECKPHLSPENLERHAKLDFRDSIAWVESELLPRLEVGRRLGSATLHPTCATRHLGLADALGRIGDAIADDASSPVVATCCGFAGDRGLLHPELTRSATAEEAFEVRSRDFDAHLSSNRTCELGLEHGTGRPYTSFVHALEELTGPVAPGVER
jgi:D-lactate dehydrogenase